MTIRIGISGAHSTGKTTLAKSLSLYFNFGLISEIARNYDKKELSKCTTQYEILCRQIISEINGEGNLILDRTVIDNFAYVNEFCRYSQKLHRLVLHWCSENYDFILFPLIENIPITNDGYRFIDPIQQKRIEDRIKNILDASGVKYYKLTGNEAKRYDQAKKIIKDELNI